MCWNSQDLSWKAPEWHPDEATPNQGDDIAGIVHAVGEGVTEFRKGDRVAAFHQMQKPGGSYAEYAVSWASTTFFLPEKTSFKEGAALPLAAMTACIGLFASHTLALPQPWTPATKEIPLLIYGAATAVGNYAIQLARKANIHPIIAVAGNSQDFVEKLIDRSKGDIIIDYREGYNAMQKSIRAKLGNRPLIHAYDCISEHGSYQAICEVLHPTEGKITLVHPRQTYPEIPPTIQKSKTYVADVHNGLKEGMDDFGYVYFRYLTRGLEAGWFKAHPQEECPGGLEGISGALVKLKHGKSNAVKFVFKIEDTPGAGQDTNGSS